MQTDQNEESLLRSVALQNARSLRLAREQAEQELLQTQETLRRSQQELADFIENASVAMHSVGPDGLILWANRAELEMLGYTKGEYVGHHIAEFHADQPVIENILRRQANGETVHEEEARMRCKDGTIREVLISSSGRWADGKLLHTRCFTRDISKRKPAELARARLAAIVESSDDAIVSKDLNGVITSWNRGAERLFGYSPQEAIGQPVTLLIPTDLFDEEPDILKRIRRGEKIEHYETVRRRKDGTLVNISLTVSPIIDARGQIVGASKVARDITGRKQTEAALQHANERLANQAAGLERLVTERTAELTATNKQLEAFVYSIAHDLRAPLRAMEGYSAMLLEEAGAVLNETTRGYANRINKSAQVLDTLLRDLLAFSRLTQERIELAPVKLESAVQFALDLLQEEIQRKKARVEIARPLPTVLAHAPTLGQVMVNLVSNALKFVAPGQPPLIRLRAEERGEFVRLWVEDNGIGIAPEHQEQIFRLFTRLHGATYGGTGIGLTVVKHGIERLRGQVGLESARGQGSRFWVELQKAQKEAKLDKQDE